MGIGKSILGFTTFDFYTPEIDIFIKILSEKLQANFIVNTYDIDSNLLNEENKSWDFLKNNTCKLIIEYMLNEDDSINQNPQYRLKIPINYSWENELELAFFPNGMLEITYLTFDHLWSKFIDILKFEYSETERGYAFKRYHTLRNEYVPILTKLGVAGLLIVSHAYYSLEYLMDDENYTGLQFSAILEVARNEDKLYIVDFLELLKTETRDDLSFDFLNKTDLEIALVDCLILE